MTADQKRRPGLVVDQYGHRDPGQLVARDGQQLGQPDGRGTRRRRRRCGTSRGPTSRGLEAPARHPQPLHSPAAPVIARRDVLAPTRNLLADYCRAMRSPPECDQRRRTAGGWSGDGRGSARREAARITVGRSGVTIWRCPKTACYPQAHGHKGQVRIGFADGKAAAPRPAICLARARAGGRGQTGDVAACRAGDRVMRRSAGSGPQSGWAWHAAAAASFALIVAAGLLVMEPAAGDPVALAAQLNVADANVFSGTPAVGALFYRENGRLTHFCTASVLRSKAPEPGRHRGPLPAGQEPVRADVRARLPRRDLSLRPLGHPRRLYRPGLAGAPGPRR